VYKKLIKLQQVLTGATGSLGAHLLHRLLHTENVATVVCLVRGNSHSEARRRVGDSLAARGLPSIEALSEESRLVVYAVDLAEADL
jgi:thioester reductase-like protein